ncbi:ATP-binding protein, partial [Nocardia nova]|uniref:ATP-binding protein n=1 Tax=Nocardia nova TaxID=37330 RepID=UPI001C4851A0|nr:ATP-binding protein [Nocardia nova]
MGEGISVHYPHSTSVSSMDARGAQGVIIGGSNNRQVIYSYTRRDGVTPAPLITVNGRIEYPYRGLSWFTDTDAELFFGRDTAIDAVLHRLSECTRESGMLMVSGVSGAGKTSLLRAGVLPRIAGEGLPGLPEAHQWPHAVIVPGHDPLDELALAAAQLAGLEATTIRQGLREDPASFALTAAQATRGPDTPISAGHRRLLLVVDQFEQLFTQCSDPALRQAFVTALHAAATGRGAGGFGTAAALVVLVVRADFEARCADFEQLAGDVIQNRYLVTAMTDRQLRLAITQPAEKAGSRVEDDLAEQLLREIRSHTIESASPTAQSGAGVLPLLSHALDQAWRTRAGETLTIADYERTGGIERALADSAQRVYDALTPSQQTIARRIFTRLTVTGADGTDTADRVRREDLASVAEDAGQVEAVLEAFAAERLLTLGTDTVEISHEVLLTAWDLLRDTWLSDTRDTRAALTRLRTVASEWERSGRDVSYLFTGSRLDTAIATADRITSDPARYSPLSATESEFLHASTRAARRRTRHLQGIIALLTVLTIVLGTVAVKAVQAGRNATRQRDIAVAEQLIDQSKNIGASDPRLARLESLAAWSIHPTDQARDAMLTAAALPALAILTGHTDTVAGVAF